MDSNAKGNADSKAEFRKPSNDAANRKYRRRSPMAGSPSSSDGSPPRDRSSSPVPLRKDITKVADDEQKRDDGRNRTSSRSHHRHDDHIRRDKRVDDYDRGYSKQSYRSSRDSRDNSNSNYSRSDREHPSRHYVKDVDTYSRAKSDGLGHRSRDKDSYDRGDRYGRTDYRKSSLDHKGDDYYSRRDSSGYRLKESSSRDYTEIDPNDEKKRVDMGSHKVQINRDTKENSGSMSDKGEEAVAKKPKTLSPDGNAAGLDGPPEKSYVTDSDIDAAKVAAMKAAELVNKNLIGTGCMTADQKKKLLWGNKKNTSTEEPAHRWDTTMFGDRERQEKFNKLMGVKVVESKVATKLDNPDVEKQQEQLQMELERQYTAGLRRRDGRTVGLGL
ncbi:arginine/serine-rich coiled-coil protein 2 [Striga asiatica]|uniref:Arginine/serine-rich coiled-coil protein 2 n=1 Tax=Striga asiatica TaxID=4170 RepID=A0A5A7R565_STRAF|nr:arginine/serine-rich coiled-coil protein 2 [Striga asiatica]